MPNVEERTENASTLPFRIPEGVALFAVQKRVYDKKTNAERFKTQSFDDPEQPGVRLQRMPVEVLADYPRAVAVFRELWDEGVYRLRWLTAEGAPKGVSPEIEAVDPRKQAERPAFALPLRASPTINAVTGRPEVATASDALAILPKEVQQFVAMQTALRSAGASDMVAQFQGIATLMATIMPKQEARPAFDPRELTYALRDAIDPLRETIREQSRRLAALEGGAGGGEDEDDDIDWDSPLGNIIGREVKKAIVEILDDVTPEMLPMIKAAIPALFGALRKKIQEAQAKRAAGGAANDAAEAAAE